MKYALRAVTALPLVLAAAATAETKISTATTAPVSTSTIASGARDDLTIEKAGSVKPAAAGVAITIDSANKVRNEGEIAFDDKGPSTGVLFTGAGPASFENLGTLRLAEDFTGKDDDSDGDLDGVFATGSGRHGVRLAAGTTLVGNVTNGATGVVTIEGNDSSGIRLDGRLRGNLVNAGSISIIGDRSVGVLATAVEGDVAITGTVVAVGEASSAVTLGDVTGAVRLQNAITATGYRNTDRLAEAARAKLDADDLKQGGAAVRISGNVGGGILLDRPPADASADDKDEDKDGTPDADERTASLTSFGAAPALDLGGSAATVIGRVGTGDNGYGLVIKGQVRGLGVNDGVAATAIRIGQPGGGTTTIDGGINNLGGTITATAFGAGATALLLNGGARADALRNSGEISATASTDGTAGATAVRVEAGAVLAGLRNDGTIGAQLSGEAGDATAILDRSGTLSLIETTGRILAQVTPTDDATDKDDADTDPGNETVTGRAVAIDLSANGAGALVRQLSASATAKAPEMRGDLLFGAGADRLELLAGTYVGTLSFGAGTDSLLIDGGAIVGARLVDDDGALAVDIRKGTFALANSEPLRIGSLSLAADSHLLLSIDPAAATAPRFDVTGAATIASGAKIEVNLGSLLRDPREFEILRAGTLTLGDASTALTGAPYLYTANLRRDGGSLYVGVRAKTATELELNRSGAQAYAAVFDRLDRDARIEAAFLAAESRDEFLGLYDQMLPDHSGGSLMSAAAISSALSSAIQQPIGRTEDGSGLAVWGQEILFNISRDAEDARGFKADGLGLAAGVERAGNGHALGIAASFVATTYDDRGAAADEEVVMQFAEASAYWRTEIGGLRAKLRGGLGHAWFDSDRKLVSAIDGLDLTARGDWTGWLADAHAAASYELGSSWLIARPEVSVDYLFLKEKGYRESGGGEGFDLEVDSRDGHVLTGTAALSLGARFGGAFRWGPEIKAGYRQRLAGRAGVTTARFVSGGSDFSLSPEELPSGETMAQLAVRGETDGIAFSIEGGTAFDGAYEQYDLRAVVRFSF